MKKVKCLICGKKWGVSSKADTKCYICPPCWYKKKSPQGGNLDEDSEK